MVKIGFRERKTLACLNTGHILHEERNSINTKNLLSTGGISIDQISNIIGRSRGDNYTCSPHHFDRSIDVHIIKSRLLNKNWYIKWYFLEPNCIFISIHH